MRSFANLRDSPCINNTNTQDKMGHKIKMTMNVNGATESIAVSITLFAVQFFFNAIYFATNFIRYILRRILENYK